MKTSFWGNLPALIITIATFLLPIIFIPVQFIDFLSTKSGLMTIGLSVALFIWAINRLKENSVTIPFNLLTLFGVLVPITYFASAVASGSFRLAFFGRDLGVDSAMMLVVFFVLMFVVGNLFQSVRRSKTLSRVVLGSVFVVLVFHVARLALLNFFPSLGFFLESSTNTIGQWYDLAIFAGLAVIASLASIELGQKRDAKKIGTLVLLVLGLLTLALVNFVALWVVVGLFALIFFVYSYSKQKNTSMEMGESSKQIPVASLVTFLIAAIVVLSGGQITERITSPLNISFLEARPSFETNLSVAKSVLSENLLLGEGPAQFDKAWIAHKPLNFNNTEFWSIDFRYGHDLMLSYFVMGGLLNILAWALFLGTYLFVGLKSIFRKFENAESAYLLTTSFLSSLYLWIMNFVYSPSFTNVALTFITTGLFIGSLYRENILKTRIVDTGVKPAAGFAYIFSLVLVMLVTLTSTWHFTTRTIAAKNFRESVIALNAGDLDRAESKNLAALSLYQNDTYLLSLSNIGFNRLAQVVENTSGLSDADQANAFRSVLSQTSQAIQGSLAFDSENYRAFVRAGEVFESILPLGVEGSYEEAKSAYELARNLNAKNPSIVLSLARLEVANGNNDGARELIAETLRLKGNYTDAIFLLSQIDVAEGNITKAINNVEQASLIRPNDPLVFFQLGILKYQNDDFRGAVPAFERAVILNNGYANARYFLGLSYDQVGRTEDAIIQFDILSTLYPSNEEVKRILQNLQSGDDAIESDEEEAPEDREELPIDEEVEAEETIEIEA